MSLYFDQKIEIFGAAYPCNRSPWIMKSVVSVDLFAKTLPPLISTSNLVDVTNSTFKFGPPKTACDIPAEGNFILLKTVDVLKEIPNFDGIMVKTGKSHNTSD